MANPKKLYDVHCHAVNLSHAGLLAFINRTINRLVLRFSDLVGGRFGKILWRLIPPQKGIGWVRTIVKTAIVLIGLFAFFLVLLWLLVFKRRKAQARIKRIINLLSVMENDVGSMFRLMEIDILALDDDLKECLEPSRAKDRQQRIGNYNRAAEKWNTRPVKTFCINEQEYEKVVITPLMMDFGFKNFEEIKGIHYRHAPSKPVVEQVVDVFNGIKSYLKNSPFKILEIYPFLGLNTQNYDLGSVQRIVDERIPDSIQNADLVAKADYIGKTRKLLIFEKINDDEKNRWLSLFPRPQDGELRAAISEAIGGFQKDSSRGTNVPRMFRKYFGLYEPVEETFSREFQKNFSGKSDRQIINGDEEFSFFFAGIKLYPPLGFDPWPERSGDREDAATEFAKVNFLYQYCQRKKIPLTVHCNRGGFITCEGYETLTEPERWEGVLAAYPDLKINFAHFGLGDAPWGKEMPRWMRDILDLILRYDGVYADFSYAGCNREFFKKFSGWLRAWKRDHSKEEWCKVQERILFGSDFLISLLDCDSYLQCLQRFFHSSLSPSEIELFSSQNPRRFLFGQQ